MRRAWLQCCDAGVISEVILFKSAQGLEHILDLVELLSSVSGCRWV